MEQKRIGIIGSGSWATAIAKIVTENGHQITWCLRQQSNIDYFEKRKHNPHYLRNAYFDLQKISFSTDIKLVVAASDIIIIAVPSIHIETTLASLEVGDLKDKLIVSAVKGVLPVHNILLNDWLAQKFNFPLSSYFTLLGPSHAEEVAAEQLSYLTFSGLDVTATTNIASYFKSEYINTIVNNDVIGVQYAGVAKNIYALGAGIAHGLEYGDNFLSVFIANCANEMQVLLKEIAKKEQIFIGIKLVRGAYMEKERERAKRLNYNSPICLTKSATDDQFNNCLKYSSIMLLFIAEKIFISKLSYFVIFIGNTK